MPVAVRLSRKFYDTFGDDVVNELVGVLNQVDATYRLELREQNDLNFARFDAKLEQRLAQLDAKWDRRFAQLDAKLERRTTELRAEFREELAKFEGRMLARFGGIEGRFGTFEGRIVKWMFLFWVSSIGTMIALIKL
jgi:hypothetical protein